jgi:hypothetical protein
LGWTEIRLSQIFHPLPPSDGLLQVNLIGDQPSPATLVGQQITTVHAEAVFGAPDWLKVVRVNGDLNHVDAVPAEIPVAAAPEITLRSRSDRASVEYNLGSYDDSHQPIGMCSPWSVKMKKLRHELTLIVVGPDEARIRQCVEQAAAAGLLAAIIAVVFTGGSALSAAVQAFSTYLEACLGSSVSVRIDDRSHWIEWCT